MEDLAAPPVTYNFSESDPACAAVGRIEEACSGEIAARCLPSGTPAEASHSCWE